ncbi:ABC transporter substrate-binding protein [Gemmobacter sp. 24YEA27]|uniref:ABC transporter substrate-binding protein n=1 Tax=Gemmobacter sp. 24YEA27 TaxID=3040672 RepID=UPI0024B3527E|nr:ABC transporter substrate-binding protein [Gemmobacter sp. 24YEA27]
MIRFRPLSLTAALLTALAQPALAEIRATDILGREVVLEAPATRIVLGEGRHLAVLGLLHDDPVAKVIGWRTDKGLDEPTLAAYRAKFPAIDAIRPVGTGNREISVETIISLDPDLVVLSLMDEGNPAMERARDQIEAAGIAVAYVDFFAHPQENSIPSLRLLGELTDGTARAEEFAEFYETRLKRIRDRLADPAIRRPRVFFHVHAAPTNCCSTVGSGVFRDFIETAGGANIGSDVVQGVLGNVSLEFLIGADPEFYVATGGDHMRARGGLVLGSDITAPEARESFDALIGATGFNALTAVAEGRAYGVWHLFNDTPSHIALIEYLAKAFHPDLFEDVAPAATLNEIETRFSPVQVPGTWWISEET